MTKQPLNDIDEWIQKIHVLVKENVPSGCRKEEIDFIVDLIVDPLEKKTQKELDKEELRSNLDEILQETELFDTEIIPSLIDQFITLIDPSTEEEKEEDTQVLWEQEYVIGKRCLALLEEDDDWHPAIICDSRFDEETIQVEFLEYGKKQWNAMDEIVLEEYLPKEEGEYQSRTKECEICERPMPLTEHHLYPRTTHAKYIKKGFSKEFLTKHIVMICRPCHSKVHQVEDEKTLAEHYNSLEKIVQHPEIIRWIKYASKQKVRIKPLINKSKSI